MSRPLPRVLALIALALPFRGATALAQTPPDPAAPAASGAPGAPAAIPPSPAAPPSTASPPPAAPPGATVPSGEPTAGISPGAAPLEVARSGRRVPEPSARKQTLPPRPHLAPQWGIGGRFSPRYVWVNSKGYDPFSKNDLLYGVHLEGMLRVWHEGPLSAWALVGWSTGGGGSPTKARDLSSSLLFHDLQVGIEGRYALNRRFSLQARLAPGAHYFRTRLTSTDLPYDLVAKNWTWSLDATAGAAVMIGAVGDDDWPSARFWFSAEGGYTMTGSVENRLRAAVDDEDEQRRHGVTTLPSLSASGALLRVSFGVTF